jgi:hypothetical protein
MCGFVPLPNLRRIIDRRYTFTADDLRIVNNRKPAILFYYPYTDYNFSNGHGHSVRRESCPVSTSALFPGPRKSLVARRWWSTESLSGSARSRQPGRSYNNGGIRWIPPISAPAFIYEDRVHHSHRRACFYGNRYRNYYGVRA